MQVYSKEKEKSQQVDGGKDQSVRKMNERDPLERERDPHYTYIYNEEG